MQPTRHTKAFKKKPSQLDREIAEAIGHRPSQRKRTHRHHAVVQQVPAADAWDVAMDALLEHDASRAATIVNNLRRDPDAIPITPAFSRALSKVPVGTRTAFEKATGIVSKHSYDWPTFIEGAAFGFWASPYMSEVENLAETAREQDDPELENAYREAYDTLSPGPGGDWEDVMPEPPPAARAVAKRFAKAVRDQLTDDQLGEIAAKFSARNAGYYGAMQSQGEGVGWHDEGVRVNPPRGFGDDVKIHNAVYAAIKRGVRVAGIKLPL